MTSKERIRCQAIAKKIQKGAYGKWPEDKESIIKKVTFEYNLTEEMVNYILDLLK